MIRPVAVYPMSASQFKHFLPNLTLARAQYQKGKEGGASLGFSIRKGQEEGVAERRKRAHLARPVAGAAAARECRAPDS